MNAAPLLDEKGRVRGAVGGIDRSDRTKASRTGRSGESEERFGVALKNSPIAVFKQDLDLRYTWLHNTQLPEPAASYLGKTPEDLFGSEKASA